MSSKNLVAELGQWQLVDGPENINPLSLQRQACGKKEDASLLCEVLDRVRLLTHSPHLDPFRLEEVEVASVGSRVHGVWRKRAGWFDSDTRDREFNFSLG